MAINEMYRPEDYSEKEVEMMRKFNLQRDDAKQYFEQIIKPRLDRSYKLYISYNGDRQKRIKKWQANIFVPYIHAVVETLMPRILDARPDFSVQGRNEDDQKRANRVQELADYTWEVANMDKVAEDMTRSSLVYGMGYMQVYWRKDQRELKFLDTKDLSKKSYKYNKETKIFYDAPYAEHVDNYNLWYDWRNRDASGKQFWFKRLLLNGSQIKRRYPMANKKRLEQAFNSGSGDLTDYASVRNEVKLVHDSVYKGADNAQTGGGLDNTMYQGSASEDLKMYEVFEWWRPFDDEYAVMVNDVPILKGGSIPNPYNFKESPFIAIPYLSIPNEFEGYGIPLVLENPQLMLNMVKNQRLDATTLNIHKMWVVNPLANVDKSELVTRPFGIIYSPDPNAVREIQFSDVKASVFKEEEMVKNDMRYASGIDDFSMGANAQAGSATEVRHLRESTLERVRLFINHLGDGFAKLMRYWISMYSQFMSNDMKIRIVGDSGEEEFPIIQKDDLFGEFDFRATVVPSIAGQNDIEKKQSMDLFQLLINLPFVDPKKLTAKVLYKWDWTLDSVSKMSEDPSQKQIEELARQQSGANGPRGIPYRPRSITPEMAQEVLSILGDREASQFIGSGTENTPFNEASAPINLLKSGSIPPTPKGVPAQTSNPRGLNRGGKLNTNIPLRDTATPDSSLSNRALNLQS